MMSLSPLVHGDEVRLEYTLESPPYIAERSGVVLDPVESEEEEEIGRRDLRHARTHESGSIRHAYNLGDPGM